MKFDFCIGNPPYQDDTIGDNKTYAPPVYHDFINAAYNIADKVELIHPARFLFNAGSTPKAWNKQMLMDPNFKVLFYDDNSKNAFSNTEIKGGICISYHDVDQEYGPIEIFTPYALLNTVLTKVRFSPEFQSLADIIVTSYAYHFKEKLYEDNPDLRDSLSKGHEYDLKSNVFQKMPSIFFDSIDESKREGYILILGRIDNVRAYKYVKKAYINDVVNLYKYKVFLPGATGSGSFGETLAAPICSEPGVGSTETFLSIGAFDSQEETFAVEKYIKTKFARALFSVLKRTQANTPDKWKYVPLQDFTSNSDIDWSVSVAEIDRQLYKKYGLDAEEIAFIEENVKEMA